ncbi:MAG: NAD-dependent epimerase/dehydratase family protein [Legionella sp.]|nr:NAD-dependent epimerase/dehydratase family protein [Legionella sp.]
MTVLITGTAGFIGFHLALSYLERGQVVIGVDNLNAYYDVQLKQDRLALLSAYTNFHFYRLDISDLEKVKAVFKAHHPEKVVHLAAQAGVRYSLTNPALYAQTNVIGFTHIIEACHLFSVKHLIYASTSSVYGANTQLPYQETETVEQPLNVYAATKKANELIAHAYSHLYQLPTTGLRFFTVYGPWGRPDMAFFSFTRNILLGEPIEVYHQGQMQRDFTYIDDIVQGISLVLDSTVSPVQGTKPSDHYKIYNIGYGQPINLLDYIEAIEEATGKKAIKIFAPRQKSDVLATHADITRLKEDFGYNPNIHYQEGIYRFVKWYRDYTAL